MAVRDSASPNGAGARRAWFVAACLVVLFVAALFLRAYWNQDAAHIVTTDEATGAVSHSFVLSGGSDPYYHKRAVDAIQANGFNHFLSDPLLNYPQGSENPNPPIYQWSIAVAGQLMEPFFDPLPASGGGTYSALEVATWQATIWSPAIFGALTIIPLYFLAAALFDRRVGLVAALLWTVSTSAIDAGGVGLADHDAAVVFFVVLAFAFYVQMIRTFRGTGNWITKWSDGGAISSGLGRLFRERSTGFAYAILTAISIAAVALTWKGFNYVIGIIFAYAILQMVIDHWRNRDSTGLFLGTLVALAGGVLLALPYYTTANVGNFLQPTWYILAAFVVAGIALVPTRDLPTILVFPIALGVGLVLAIVAFFVFPEIAQSLLYATVYFKQTRLYETIAEAHPADFSTIAFGIGPLAFFLAVGGWFYLLFTGGTDRSRGWVYTGAFAAAIGAILIVSALTGLILRAVKLEGAIDPVHNVLNLVAIALAVVWFVALVGASAETRPVAFALVWAAVAVFMAQSAVRFLLHAIPVFCVFAAFMTIWIIDWLDFNAIRKSVAANRGNFWGGIRRGTRPLHIVAVVLVALLFVFPTTMLAADAALPPEAESKFAQDSDSPFVQRFFTERMGAYGQGFGGVKPWIPAFEFLKEHDANISDPAARPAFISWWDYGHWAISISEHPAVADNFQNGYELAANFILAQDEAHSIQLLAARLAEAPGADLGKAMTELGVANASAEAENVQNWRKANLTLQQSADLLAKVEDQTGKSIRYFATDIRMLPYDNPQSPNIEAGSIFYAPVTLKGDEPNDYVTTQVSLNPAPITAQDGYVTVPEYERLASDPIKQYSVLGERYAFQQRFFDSTYWHHFVGTPVSSNGDVIVGSDMERALNNPRPAYGLEHFRAIYIGEITRIYRGGDPSDVSSFIYYPEIVITEYYPGAIVEGTVTEDGAPLGGVQVTVFDDAGRLIADRFGGQIEADQFHVPHATVTTDADGKFRILAPFALEGGNVTLLASRGDVRLGTAALAITRQDAEEGKTFSDVAITVARGTVEGTVFRDADGNGLFDQANETTVADVNVTIGGKTATSGADGKYRVESVPAGSQNVTVDSADLEVVPATSRVSVRPSEVVTRDIGLAAKAATVNGIVLATINGTDTPAGFASVRFAAAENVTGNTAVTQPGFTSQPDGSFNLTAPPGTYTVTVNYTPPGSTTEYTLEETITLAPGEVVTRDFRVAERTA